MDLWHTVDEYLGWSVSTGFVCKTWGDFLHNDDDWFGKRMVGNECMIMMTSKKLYNIVFSVSHIILFIFMLDFCSFFFQTLKNRRSEDPVGKNESH